MIIMLYKNYFKRVIDILLSMLLLIITSPLLIAFSFLIKLKYKCEAFFIHERPGLNGKSIKLIKFVTMNNQKDAKGKLLPNVQRITALGVFLRKTSIDELPQLINVLKGDISFVGPRPLESRYLRLYTKEQNRRHEVKPGITGWAQVNGRNSISWEEKFRLDIWYVDNVSFLLDLKIILKTIKKVITSEGINMDEENTIIPFDIYLQRKKQTN